VAAWPLTLPVWLPLVIAETLRRYRGLLAFALA